MLVIRPGMRLQEGDLQVTCIQPEEEFPGEIGNASSMVLDICYQKFGMLCTGDVEEKGEEILLEQVEKKGVFGAESGTSRVKKFDQGRAFKDNPAKYFANLGWERKPIRASA